MEKSRHNTESSFHLRCPLHGDLHVQAGRLPLPPRERRLVASIIDSLDADGFLRRDLAQVGARAALDTEPDFTELNTALRVVQSLAPAGVGARNAAECRRLQLRRCGRAGPIAPRASAPAGSRR